MKDKKYHNKACCQGKCYCNMGQRVILVKRLQLTVDYWEYEKCNEYPAAPLNKEIRSTLSSMLSRKKIDKKLMNYLIKKKPQLGRFYLSPKIHERTLNVPGRPGVSNIRTVPENISAFLGFYLNPVVQTTPHIFENTRDFLSRLSYLQDIPENAILVSFDVVRLYPNIPHEEGIDLWKHF